MQFTDFQLCGISHIRAKFRRQLSTSARTVGWLACVHVRKATSHRDANHETFTMEDARRDRGWVYDGGCACGAKPGAGRQGPGGGNRRDEVALQASRSAQH